MASTNRLLCRQIPDVRVDAIWNEKKKLKKVEARNHCLTLDGIVYNDSGFFFSTPLPLTPDFTQLYLNLRFPFSVEMVNASGNVNVAKGVYGTG